MIGASFSIILCEKEITALEKKWRSLYELKEVRGYADNKATAEGQPRGPTRYDIKVNLMRSALSRIEIQFCDKYTFFRFDDHRLSGVYYRTEQNPEKYVSTVEYPRAFMPKKGEQGRLKDLKLHFKCDLIKKTVFVYMDGKFMEKVYLGPGPVNYSFGLAIQRDRKKIMLTKLEISDYEGKTLFHVDLVLLLLYKRISQMLLSLGVLIFLALACSEKIFFRKVLFFVSPLFLLEAFLGVAYDRSPDLDIHQLKPKWQFEISTNFYRAFNNPKEITINSYLPFFAPRRTYPIANPERAVRIICIGSSPLVRVLGVVPRQAFPALLEKKLDSWNKKKNMVMPITVPQTEYFNGIEPNIFLREVLSRMNPDLLLYYGKLAFMTEGYFKELSEEDSVLYNRAKNIIKKNFSWIKNDRLLYAALEFKEPVKEVVYLYDFLCESYLFMAVENIRKRVFEKWRSGDRKTLVESPESFFEEVLELCKEKGIKVVFIPQLDFSTRSNDKPTETFLMYLHMQHPEIYYLSLEGVFNGNENFLLAGDRSHLNEYGHKVIAQEIFRQLTEKGLLNTH